MIFMLLWLVAMATNMAVSYKPNIKTISTFYLLLDSNPICCALELSKEGLCQISKPDSSRNQRKKIEILLLYVVLVLVPYEPG